MMLANPAGLWFGVLAIPIIAFHLYRERVRRKAVSSLLLWRMMDLDKEVPAGVKILQRFASLLLNLGILAFITLAISQPQIKGLTKSKEKYVIILDNSLSMQAREEGGTRFAIAKNEALKIMRSLGRRDEVALLDINGNAIPWTSDNIKKMDYQTKHLELADLFDIARRASGDANVIFISDGSGDQTLGGLIKSYGVNYIRVGGARENFAIIDGNLVKGAGDKNFTLFLRLLIPDKTNLKIEINGEELGVFELRKGQSDFTLPIPEGESGFLVAKILAEDALPEDNVAYFVLPPLVKPPVAYFYADRPDKFVIDVINTLGKEGDIDLEKSFSAHISKLGEVNLEKFLAIIENCRLPQMPKAGTFIFINSTFEQSQPIEEVKNLFVHKTLLTDTVEFDKLEIKKAWVSAVKDYEKPLVEVDNRAIAKVGRVGMTAYVWIGFSLESSDFALHPAFPIFFKNVVNWAMLEAHRNLAYSYKLGEVSVPVPLKKAGFCKLGDEDLSINFFDEKESNIAPVETDSAHLQISIVKWYQDLPLENLLVLIAVLLLLSEWLLYYRGLI